MTDLISREAALALPSVGVTVKPLEWVGDPKWPGTAWAEGRGTGYQINEQDENAWLMTTPTGNSVMCETLDAARAAAQADYAARIMAAIEVTPASEELTAQLAAVRADKDAAYLERNKLVALLAGLFPSGVKKTAIEGWSPDWHGCVYIDFPWGQASWHYHDSHAHLFTHLPPYDGEWSGHTTEEKYAAIEVAAKSRPLRSIAEGGE